MSSRRGLSLIEILIVIGVLVLILAISIPVLSLAKRSAKVEEGKQYLRQQFVAIELYSADADGAYPNSRDLLSDRKMQVPCSRLYDWRRPCWPAVTEQPPLSIDPSRSPVLGGRGYLYALDNWRELDDLKPDEFLGWDRSKPYPLLADIFAAQYRVAEFSGSVPDPRQCTKFTQGSGRGCDYPEVIWFGYSDGSLRKWRRPVRVDGKPRELFDWFHVFSRRMDVDTLAGD